MRSGVVLAAGLVGCLSLSGAAAQQPTFRTTAETIVVDVQVVRRDGTPVRGLAPADFDVRIGGRRRPVVSAQFIDTATAPARTGEETAGPPTAAADGATASPAFARTYVLAVDESSFDATSVLAYRAGLKRFLDVVGPGDLVGLQAFPGGGPWLPPTTDRVALRSAIDLLAGRRELPRTRFRLSRGEMLDITAGDRQVLLRVAQRECAVIDRRYCEQIDLPRAALEMAMQMEAWQAQTLSGLRAVLADVARISGRKTVVVVSGGLASSDRPASRGATESLVRELGREAERANLNLYVLHLDSTFLSAFSPTSRTQVSDVFRDESLLRQGLEQFADVAGGTLLRAQTGVGDNLLARVLLETSGYYLLGVERDREDRPGQSQAIEVRVARRDTDVRSRRWVTIPK